MYSSLKNISLRCFSSIWHLWVVEDRKKWESTISIGGTKMCENQKCGYILFFSRPGYVPCPDLGKRTTHSRCIHDARPSTCPFGCMYVNVYVYVCGMCAYVSVRVFVYTCDVCWRRNMSVVYTVSVCIPIFHLKKNWNRFAKFFTVVPFSPSQILPPSHPNPPANCPLLFRFPVFLKNIPPLIFILTPPAHNTFFGFCTSRKQRSSWRNVLLK